MKNIMTKNMNTKIRNQKETIKELKKKLTSELKTLYKLQSEEALKLINNSEPETFEVIYHGWYTPILRAEEIHNQYDSVGPENISQLMILDMYSPGLMVRLTAADCSIVTRAGYLKYMRRISDGKPILELI